MFMFDDGVLETSSRRIISMPKSASVKSSVFFHGLLSQTNCALKMIIYEVLLSTVAFLQEIF
jgi:hypothetical protein